MLKSRDWMFISMETGQNRSILNVDQFIRTWLTVVQYRKRLKKPFNYAISVLDSCSWPVQTTAPKTLWSTVVTCWSPATWACEIWNYHTGSNTKEGNISGNHSFLLKMHEISSIFLNFLQFFIKIQWNLQKFIQNCIKLPQIRKIA